MLLIQITINKININFGRVNFAENEGIGFLNQKKHLFGGDGDGVVEESTLKNKATMIRSS